MTFHAWLRREMERRKLSIAKFSAILGYNTEMIRRWRTDRKPNEYQMSDIATAFGIDRKQINYSGSRPRKEWDEYHAQNLLLDRKLGMSLERFSEVTGFPIRFVCHKWREIEADRIASGLPCLRPWTKANDRALLSMVGFGKDWPDIAKCLSRTVRACKARLQKLNKQEAA